MTNYLLIFFSLFKDIESIGKLCLLIDSKIYGFFAKLYSFYIDLAGRRIFSNEAIESLANRIYIFIGVIALFFIAYSLLKGLVDPDKGLKDMGGKFVFKIVSSLIMLLVVPIIFELGYKIQEIIVNEGIVERIFLNTSTDLKEDVVLPVEFTTGADESSQSKMEETTNVNLSAVKSTLQLYGNQTAYLVLSAFLYPLEEEVMVDASKYFNSGTDLTISGIGAATGALSVGVALASVALIPATGGASLTAIPIALKGLVGSSLGAMALGGLIGGAVGHGVNDKLEKITLSEYKWSEAETLMVYSGDFDQITVFAEAVDDGRMEYTPIISTICGAILVYLMLGFCIDLGIRAAKLAMYQMLAPVPILLRIVPGQDKVFNEWIKQVLLTFFEVIVRIGILFGITYLISLVPQLTIFSNDSNGLLGRAVIVLGLIAFVKEAPKLLSTAIGIKGAGDMKFGLKDKLAATGALTAAAAIGGGVAGLARNGFNAGKNVTKSIKDRDKKGALKAAGKGALSAFAGGMSGAYTAGKAGWNAKSYADVSSAVSKGAKHSLAKRQDREEYKATHKNVGGLTGIPATIFGHVSDAQTSFLDTIGGTRDLASLEEKKKVFEQIKGIRNQFFDLTEDKADLIKTYNKSLEALEKEEIKNTTTGLKASKIGEFIQMCRNNGIDLSVLDDTKITEFSDFLTTNGIDISTLNLATSENDRRTALALAKGKGLDVSNYVKSLDLTDSTSQQIAIDLVAEPKVQIGEAFTEKLKKDLRARGVDISHLDLSNAIDQSYAINVAQSVGLDINPYCKEIDISKIDAIRDKCNLVGIDLAKFDLTSTSGKQALMNLAEFKGIDISDVYKTTITSSPSFDLKDFLGERALTAEEWNAAVKAKNDKILKLKEERDNAQSKLIQTVFDDITNNTWENTAMGFLGYTASDLATMDTDTKQAVEAKTRIIIDAYQNLQKSSNTTIEAARSKYSELADINLENVSSSDTVLDTKKKAERVISKFMAEEYTPAVEQDRAMKERKAAKKKD